MSSQTSSIGSCPSHWDIVKFSTVAELKHGYQFRTTDFTDQGVKVLKITQIKDNGSIDISSCSYIDSKRLESFEKNIVKKGDILMALSGATIGKIGRYKSEEIVLQNYRVGNFIPLNEEVLNKDYFYHFLTTENTYYQILANQNQSAQENIGKDDIHNMLVFLPPLPEQRTIASILSSLDDKIDLLHRQNATLETMAETLFRQLFVEEAKEDIRIPLSNYADNIRVNVKVEDLKEYDHYVGLDHMPRKNIVLSNWGKTDSLASNKSVFEKNDILFGKLRSYFHKVVFAPIKGVCSTDILVIRPKKKEWFSFCLFWFFNKDVVEHSDLGSGGTRMPRTSWEIVSSYQIPKPAINQIVEFNDVVNPMIEKIKINITQIHTLTALRDTLLPKLMSGEVRVEM